MSKSVSVIGGGIAGLSASVFLAEKGFSVTLVEASPKFGGRAYSFFDKASGLRIDNGKHILASWYKNTFDYLKLIGTYDKLSFQKQLEVVFRDSNGESYSLRASKLPPPLHLAGGIMGYKALELKDKLAVVRLVNKIKKNKFTENHLKGFNTEKLFKLTAQTDKAIDYFWKPFIIAVFNAEPQDTSAYLFSNMIRMGFIEKGGSELVLPNDFLSDIFVEPAIEYLKQKEAIILANNRVTGFKFNDTSISSLILEDMSEIQTDFYISAVPFFNFKSMLGEDVHNRFFDGLEELSHSPIVNIHLKFDKDISSIFSSEFIGLLNTSSQWVFKVTNDQVCVVISSAKEIAEKSKEFITDLALGELKICIPELIGYKVIASRVIKEMRATFVPDTRSLNNRPPSATSISNFFIAGDWTDTELPATIEGAVKSSKNCVSEILKMN
ncbi:MAG: hydroxysqualene dehydroxylase HpnE [Ignavibacteria bacterium]